MCTAITFKTQDFYFGRNLDLEYHYRETVTITPRNYEFRYRNGQRNDRHYAMIGMATVEDSYPLYYEATNETGLSMAGLNFPGNAFYHTANSATTNIAPFELIPWVLSQCATVDDAQALLSNVTIWAEPFGKDYPLSPLHWLLADKQRCITIEPLETGLRVTDNPVGVLTNNPPFDYHMYHLASYLNLTAKQPENRFSSKLELSPFSYGMGGIGLPGDLSSPSRFVRAAFGKLNSVCRSTEAESVNQFFHILSSVAQLRGLNAIQENAWEITRYSSCCNTDRCIYYYNTYENSCISAVEMFSEDLDSTALKKYPLNTVSNFITQNQKS